MPVLIKPTMACNFRCDYCYQHAIHDGWDYDLDALREAIGQHKGREITLHGGEITTLPVADLRTLLAMSYEHQQRTSLQTNAYNITDEHIGIFREFKTCVGVSMDGPWPLNRYRGFGAEREQQTAQVWENIKKLRTAGIPVSIISVITHLHAENPDLYWRWVLELQDMGIVSGRMNYVQRIPGFHGADAPSERFASFYVEMASRICEEQKLQWQPFRDVVDNLLGLGTGTCTFTKCDPYNTESALVIDGHGAAHSCLRTAQDGIARLRTDTKSIRYECLRQTPQEHGGCKDCRWWKVCYGSCPSITIDGDWRNRGVYCEVWKALYAFAERRLRGMMPNVHLVTDDEEEEYSERRSAALGARAFEAMIKPGGSTWREHCRPPKTGWEVVGPAVGKSECGRDRDAS